jgi:hypothetical protein
MKITKLQKEAIVRAIMNDVPKPDKSKRHAKVQADLVKAMSPECRKLFNKRPEIFLSHHTGDITYDGCSWGLRHVVIGDAPKGTLEKILEPYKIEDGEYHNAQINLKSAIMACTTLKALETTFPEFKKYFPTETQPTKNLPALANVVADLSKLGWPKKSGVTK